ncbi:hypothetical protein OTSUT76_3694 [Orientia tsutsugamushi str. UT76]|nr:hypothetical protein OTSUT76_3694 [Orientia tsutsugamushi str. UT76]
MAIDVKQNDDNSNYDSQTQLIEQLFSEFSPSMPFGLLLQFITLFGLMKMVMIIKLYNI